MFARTARISDLLISPSISSMSSHRSDSYLVLLKTTPLKRWTQHHGDEHTLARILDIGDKLA